MIIQNIFSLTKNNMKGKLKGNPFLMWKVIVGNTRNI